MTHKEFPEAGGGGGPGGKNSRGQSPVSGDSKILGIARAEIPLSRVPGWTEADDAAERELYQAVRNYTRERELDSLRQFAAWPAPRPIRVGAPRPVLIVVVLREKS